MVRLRFVGGRLNLELQERLDEAARAHERGEVGIAASLYHEVLGISPHNPEALHMLGVIALQEGKNELALQLIDAALTAQPDHLQARFNRCVVLRAAGRNAEALQSARKILLTAPDFAAAWDIAGQILKDDGSAAEAGKCFAHAIGLQPGNPHFLGNYSALLFTQGEWAAAYKMALKAESLDPAYPPMIFGNFLKAWGYPEQAAARFARARALPSLLAEASASEAMARLQMGDFDQGWILWEQRPDLEVALSFLPLWQGQKIDRLLLYEDQGIGDAIQFLRYIPLLKKRALHLTLRVREPLVNLVSKNFSDVRVIGEAADTPSVDARCRLSSLPFIFSTRPNTIPSAPYLTAPDSALWRERLRALPSPRIGLVWAGNANFRNDAERSMDFKILQPLLDCGATHFVSLQKERADHTAAGIFDAAPQLHDFADTASLIAALDLVISVDTATAHLAGALGKPVFLLLPFNSDWRWLLGREDSPWYGKARLFRQKEMRDWDTVIEQVATEVKKFIAGDSSVLSVPKWRGENLRQNPNALPLSA